MTLAFLLTTQNKSLATNIPLVLIVKLSQWGQYLYEVKCFIHSRIESYHLRRDHFSNHIKKNNVLKNREMACKKWVDKI